MKSRKQLEAQLKAKKEQEERQRKRDEELRLETERRKKEQLEREENEARIKEEQRIRELEFGRLHRQRSANILTKCVSALSVSIVEQWQLKQFQWCMRCDGLPDPTNLPQLNAYRYRWLETSSNTECSTDRLLARAPELNQVIHDLDELLEHTHNIPPKQVELLNQIRFDLSELLSREIDAAVKSVLNDVEKHLQPDETQLNVQISSKSFLLALGTDTAKNSSMTLHDFQRLGVKVDLPQIVLANEKPVVIALTWLRESHYLDPPILNGVPSLPSLLHQISEGDCLFEFVNQSLRKVEPKRVEEVKTELKKDLLDYDKSLLVGGVVQVQLLQLPIQPRRFVHWTVAPLEDGDAIKHFEFKASFSGATAAKETADTKNKGKNDDDDENNEGKEMNEELKKLISIKIKLPTTSFWLGCPRPFIYQKDGTWINKGVWDIRYHEEIGGPSLSFRLEEPGIVGLAQARRANIPLQGWTLFPSRIRTSFLNSLINKAPTEAAKGSSENRGGGGGGNGGEWEAGMSDESSDEDEVGGAGGRHTGGPMDQLAAAADDTEEIEYDPDARSVTLTLSGPSVSLDIEIQENQVLLRRVRTSVNVNVKDITSKAMNPFELIKSLRKRGLEISPSSKVCALIEEMPKKNPEVEKHLYRCMAILASTEKFSFLHSRWNLQAGEENFVLQYQLLDNENLTPALLAQITQERARLLPFNENSLTLEQSDVKDLDAHFFADLLNALRDSASDEVREEISDPSPAFVETIYTMLAATKVASTG